ncbi:MAG: hypothetical protein IJ723_06715, partial [Ruminococcus sp.]|nr:hypothetical protein [Ruminococcus sp.]
YVSEKVNKIGENAFGMTTDGKAIDGFTLVCPDLSPVKGYAETNSIATSLVAPKTSEGDMQEDQRLPEGINAETVFYIIVIVLVLAALAVFIILVLVLKNNKTTSNGSDIDD